ncbi:MAG TPA: hypothetical protein VF466_03170 [Candidatus Saccharimonadales bacterium]
MPEIQTLPAPEVILDPNATGNKVFEQPVQARVETIVLEGRNNEITVSDREPMMTEEDVYLQYGVHLGKLVGTYELPYDPVSERAANHTLFIFDDSNPNAKHAAPTEFTIISQRGLEAMGQSNLERRQDTYRDRDIIQIGEGQTLAVGRGHRWLPREARQALRREKRRVMSDDQAEFRVEKGELKLRANGHNPGFFTGVPNDKERAVKQDARAYEQRMEALIRSSKSAHAAAPSNTPAGIAVNVADAYITSLRESPVKTTQTRHGAHLGALLRNRAATTGRASATHDMRRGIKHRR